MTDNSSNEDLRREMMRASNEYQFNPTAATNYQHLLPAQYFTQQMYYPYVNPYSHLTEANGNMAIHGYGSDGRPKFRRSRTIFNPEQLDVLEQHFEKYKYPDVKRRKIISEEIGLPEERIQIWFQNRRAKDKRQTEQQVKLQKLVNEAIGGGTSQEATGTHIKIAQSGSSVSFTSPVQQLSQLPQQHIKDNQFETEGSQNKEEHGVEYLSSKDMFPESSEQPLDKITDSPAGSLWPNGSIEPPEPQVAIQNIDQDLLFKVANILSASNDAGQLITEWSQSPNKLQTNSLEEQLRHFAEQHQRVLAQTVTMPSTSISHGENTRAES